MSVSMCLCLSECLCLPTPPPTPNAKPALLLTSMTSVQPTGAHSPSSCRCTEINGDGNDFLGLFAVVNIGRPKHSVEVLRCGEVGRVREGGKRVGKVRLAEQR